MSEPARALAPHSIGIMQGRLVPPVGGCIQAFPTERWEEEFPLAAEIGFDSIELTIESASWDIHPVRTSSGRHRLDQLVRAHGVGLAGLCCDTAMEVPLTDPDRDARERALAMLLDLIRAAGDAGLPMVELPVMGGASLKEGTSQTDFRAAMDRALPLADACAVDVLIESDLPPKDLAFLAAAIDHPRFGINYDTGNSTWFGYDPDEELPRLMPHIRNVHIKDCTRADYSVPLGRGETRFDRVFHHLGAAGYRSGFVLQAARQPDDAGAARAYLAFSRALVAGLAKSVVPCAAQACG